VWWIEQAVPERRGDVLLLFFVLAVLPIVTWLRTGPCRIGGGRNLIRIYADYIEVPTSRARKPIKFLHGCLISTGKLGRWRTIKVVQGDTVRELSLACLEDRNDGRALLLDLQHFLDGKPAIGRAGHDVHHRTEYDDRLDRELAGLE
jgi:hypothetical protein